MTRGSWLRLVLLVLSMAYPALSAVPTGNPPPADLSGTVEDPLGAVVVNATVALLPSNGASVLVTMTNQSGHFEFHEVLPGRYRLTAEAAGFAEVSIEINVFAGQSNRMDLQFAQLAAQKQ
ncbi:MAG TPA: carboxypeptidase-like regulatory domain-containing protein [Candidatus Acidoferrum sp.]|nr:carboxypeptidase-like regulatory domain-containing protein [Candidatus Acidoferrum sp.]